MFKAPETYVSARINNILTAANIAPKAISFIPEGRSIEAISVSVNLIASTPNAFATGRNPSHAAVAVTTGIMRALDYNELSGVLGHELAHVKNRDILTGTIAAMMATVITYTAQFFAFFGGRSDDDEGGNPIAALLMVFLAPLAASLIQMAISRSREYEADHDGAVICGNANYLADALEKIEYYALNGRQMSDATPATAHMFIINPFSGIGSTMSKLFSTHPQTSERIARLRAQAAGR